VMGDTPALRATSLMVIDIVEAFPRIGHHCNDTVILITVS
jgi:hypothetical protein